MKYVKAKAQVVMFDNSDVVTASSYGNGEGYEEFQKENPDVPWGCADVASKVAE